MNGPEVESAIAGLSVAGCILWIYYGCRKAGTRATPEHDTDTTATTATDRS